MTPAIPDRVAIVLMSALGDVTFGLPLATAIRRARPDVHLTWIVQRGPDELLVGHPAVNELVHFDRKGGVAAYLDIRRRLATRPFDVVLDLQTALKAGLVTAFARAPIKWGIDRSRARDANTWFTTHQLPPAPRRHMVDQFLEFAAVLGVGPEPLDYGLRPSDAARVYANGTLPGDEPCVALVLASSAAHKNWFPERWAEVAEHLVRERRMRVVLVGGTSEVERSAASAITARVGASAINALGSGVGNAIGLLERAALVIAPDTGPLHMAVALGRPVIGLYGSTNPKWVGPYRQPTWSTIDAYGDVGEDYPSTTARREGRMARVTVAAVRDAVAQWWAERRS
jgi:heptosyltransferase I